MSKPKPDITPEEWHRRTLEACKRKAEMYNRSHGNLKDGYTDLSGKSTPGDGYDCPICMNRGNFMVVEERNGVIYEPLAECKCMNIRRAIWRLKSSGLEDSIKEYTFKRFENRGPWCEALVKKAKDFLAEGVDAGAWLYFGGQPGCGKTHICTAVCRELLAKMPVYYIVLFPGYPVTQLVYMDAVDVTEGYKGKYVDQVEATGSRMQKDGITPTNAFDKEIL